ncbi:MAG: cell wall metabolism sensor histidine kinase WalK [Firmicutes bacterium]|nr:cell wall metabolism sensor histidine kinase WalK [Bacillota bacterium]
MEQKKIETLANANIISNRIKFYIEDNAYVSLENGLKNNVENYSKEINSRIIIVNDKNLVRADSNGVHIDKKLYHDEIKSALSGSSKVSSYNFKDIGHVMYVSVPIKTDGDIVGATLISTSLRDVYARVGEISKTLNIISIISILFVAVISYLFADFFSKPIEKFTKVITKISQGKLGEKVEINTNDEFKQMATAFNMMSTKLGHVDNQRKDFVANVSHELRTPLSSMKLLSESLLHQDQAEIEVYREFLKDIDSEIDRLNHIIDDLLMLVDMDKEKLTIDYKITYMNYLVEKIFSRLKPLADEKNINLEFKAKEKLQTRVDPSKIQQSIINIIHNAIKYTPEGGSVKITLYYEFGNIVVKIKDTGIGIPKEKLPHIFERFYRVDRARSRNAGGTGLGLSIAKQIISLHQGDIQVESEVGKGTTFYIKIPDLDSGI